MMRKTVITALIACSCMAAPVHAANQAASLSVARASAETQGSELRRGGGVLILPLLGLAIVIGILVAVGSGRDDSPASP